jgi:hypothetical protein
MSNITIIPNLLKEEELDLFIKESRKEKWALVSESSAIKNNILNPAESVRFWYKELIHTKIKMLFYNKITKAINTDIDIKNVYCNGQAFGQCGFWHNDYPDTPNAFTLVYFYSEWQPEYGGHLLIKKQDEEVISFLPELNKGILFDGTLLHMALSPSRHCLTQRESLACKFIVLT